MSTLELPQHLYFNHYNLYREVCQRLAQLSNDDLDHEKVIETCYQTAIDSHSQQYFDELALHLSKQYPTSDQEEAFEAWKLFIEHIDEQVDGLRKFFGDFPYTLINLTPEGAILELNQKKRLYLH